MPSRACVPTFPWLSTWLCSIRRLSETMQPLSIVTPYWTSDDVTTDPDVTLEGSSTVDRIVASSTMHDWITADPHISQRGAKNQVDHLFCSIEQYDRSHRRWRSARLGNVGQNQAGEKEDADGTGKTRQSKLPCRLCHVRPWKVMGRTA